MTGYIQAVEEAQERQAQRTLALETVVKEYVSVLLAAETARTAELMIPWVRSDRKTKLQLESEMRDIRARRERAEAALK